MMHRRICKRSLPRQTVTRAPAHTPATEQGAGGVWGEGGYERHRLRLSRREARTELRLRSLCRLGLACVPCRLRVLCCARAGAASAGCRGGVGGAPSAMVEGPECHRVAAAHACMVGSRIVSAKSPNGKFADGAAAIEGDCLDRIEGERAARARASLRARASIARERASSTPACAAHCRAPQEGRARRDLTCALAPYVCPCAQSMARTCSTFLGKATSCTVRLRVSTLASDSHCAR